LEEKWDGGLVDCMFHEFDKGRRSLFLLLGGDGSEDMIPKYRAHAKAELGIFVMVQVMISPE